MITYRETFIGLDDTEAGFKSIGPDLGIDLANGGPRTQKRDVSPHFSLETGSPCVGSQTTSGRSCQSPRGFGRRSFRKIGHR